MSPDGGLVASASRDGTVRIWDAVEGRSIAGLPVVGGAYCVAFDTRSPFLACGDEAGNVYLAEMVGIGYGPLAVTAFDRDADRRLTCPACLRSYRVDAGWFGGTVPCPSAGCGRLLRVNPWIGRAW